MATQKDYEKMPFAELEKLYKGNCRQYKDLERETDVIRGVLAHRQEILQKEQELQALKERPIGAPPPPPVVPSTKFSGSGKAVR